MLRGTKNPSDTTLVAIPTNGIAKASYREMDWVSLHCIALGVPTIISRELFASRNDCTPASDFI
jgi:hypothetical protein